MRLILMAILISFTPNLWAGESCPDADPLKDDAFPWPWSTQCPFPWDTIEGKWTAVSAAERFFFEFDVISQSSNGEKYLVVKHFDGTEQMVARGLGISRTSGLGVMAAMHWNDPDKENSNGYWLHVSAFVDSHDSSPWACYLDQVKTAIKITPFGKEQDDEEPLIIEKMQPPEGK